MYGGVSSTVYDAKESVMFRETTIIFVNDNIKPSLEDPRRVEVGVGVPLHSEGERSQRWLLMAATHFRGKRRFQLLERPLTSIRLLVVGEDFCRGW